LFGCCAAAYALCHTAEADNRSPSDISNLLDPGTRLELLARLNVRHSCFILT
jgi:hypothetical protein